MRGHALIVLAAITTLVACDRDPAPPPTPVVPLERVPEVPPRADAPQEHPNPSVRTYPTGDIPDDPHLAAGHNVYRQTCMVCHDRGAANAPVIVDIAEWRTRIAKGRETLYRNAINGYTGARGFMPPKGGSPGNWSDEQVRAAVDYMVHVVERQAAGRSSADPVQPEKLGSLTQ